MRRVLLVALCLTSLLLAVLVTRAGSDPLLEATVAKPDHETSTAAPVTPGSVTRTSAGPDFLGAESVATPTAPPACLVADEPAVAIEYSDWRITLLDTAFMLPESYEPPDLVSAAAAFPEDPSAAGAGRLRALVIDDLRALVADAAAAGHRLAIQSAYRSYSYQASTFQYWVDLQGYDSAIATSARAGHSEHQLGTALDLRSLYGPPAWELDDWALTPEGAWVAENAWRYGFVMSFPRGQQDVSCYAYEPWHYRYFGRELAATIHASGATAREVLWRQMNDVIP